LRGAIRLKWRELIATEISTVSSHVCLFLKKNYKKGSHLCYVHVCLRFTTYECLPPLLTLRSHFIVSRKSYLLVKRW